MAGSFHCVLSLLMMHISDLSVGKQMLFPCSVSSLLTIPIPGCSGGELVMPCYFLSRLTMLVFGSLVCK